MISGEAERKEEEGEALEGEGLIIEGEDDDVQPECVLNYNSVRGYVSAIHDLWAHQVASGFHNAPEPHRVAVKALETSIVRGEHDRRRHEYTDRGVGTMRDGYLQREIPNFTYQVSLFP